ncbi:Nurim like protein [Habropoda laboriosa]|uniref:Nuclear envelope membrane protein n=1 Tax=Habropoda laboriosa TaxID=597456 RepID=A0A0L7QST1_9HYME|nr:PREDICTED: nurim homolog [Habropoda laboriosa]KOC61531.1 Nurim like protein [Habropoda laboriosa]
MFVKYISAVTCIACFLYTFYILCNLTYFLSAHDESKETIISLKKDESIESTLWLLIINMSLLSIFMLQHSLMATEFVKHLFCKLHMDYMERSIYNIASAMTLHLLFSKWQNISSTVLWEVNTSSNNVLWFTFTAFHVLAWSIIYSGCLMMDISELAGIKQVYYKFSFRPSPMVMKSKDLLRYYSHMRHPSFTGFLIVLWIYPYMTLDRLLLASIFTFYMALMWTIDKDDYNYHANLVKIKQTELF